MKKMGLSVFGESPCIPSIGACFKNVGRSLFRRPRRLKRKRPTNYPSIVYYNILCIAVGLVSSSSDLFT